jgi:hypothetical protein
MALSSGDRLGSYEIVSALGAGGMGEVYRARDLKPVGDPFDAVRQVGLTLPGVVATTRYDGSPRLTVAGIFMAGLASHSSAEPGTLVVRYDIEERAWLLEDAPEIYYLTDYYRSYPLILARLHRLDKQALHDLLTVSLRLTRKKTRGRQSVSSG